MIVLTVKTLDSQNHSFTVDENITVAEFKVKIAESINIPADTQRIIYCGRVLQDTSKLSEYDVDGKVVHLVQRAPPTTTSQSNRSPSPPPLPRRVFRGFDHGNAMYLGSMAFPSNLMESQGIAPPPPTHTLSGSRLNVAKRMLRRAEGVIRLLENPSSRTNEQTPPEEQPDEEITPIIEARVIVPSNDTGNIDEDMVLSAVRNTILNAAELSTAPLNVNPSSQTTTSDNSASAERSASTSPEETTPVNTSRENLLPDQSTSDNSNDRPNNSRTRRENASRTTEMSELLTMLNQLQTRFAPFLERYHTFMAEDPVVATEAVRTTQTMLNRVSEVLHYLGHAYHSLSDIMIRVRTSPPRPLLCRPILIQHSAVVQAGIPIPIQVEVHREPNVSSNSTGNQTTTTTNTVPQTGNASTTTVTNSETRTNNGGSTGPSVTAHIQPTVVQLPFVHTASMRLQSFPLEIRSGQRGNPIISTQRPPNTNTGSTNSTQNVSTPATNASATVASDSGAATTTTSTTSASFSSRPSGSENGFNLSNFNNSNVEFVMEFTPEGITIDSLETIRVGSNQVNDLIRGNQPDVLQSLLQTANWYMNLSNGSTSTTTNARSSTTPSNVTAAQSNTTSSSAADLNNQSSSSSSSSSSNVPSQAVGGQNSQARGNTQTNPTTSTHTRSTPRPHVHLAQQAMQGGFDPFLPCNSHHVTHRRQRGQTLTTNQQNSSQNNVPRAVPRSQLHADDQIFSNAVNGLMNTIRNVAFAHFNNSQEPSNVTNTNASTTTSTTLTNTTTTSSSSNSTNNITSTAQQQPRPRVGIHLGNSRGILHGHGEQPRHSDFLRRFTVGNFNAGPLFSEFARIISRYFGLTDVLYVTDANINELNRIADQISTFFTTRILNGENTPEAVDRGVDLIIEDIRPFIQCFNDLSVRNNIDIIKSLELLIRVKLPEVINTGANLNANNMRTFVDQCMTVASYMGKLLIYASSNEQRGLDRLVTNIISSHIKRLPAAEQRLAYNSLTANYLQFLETITVSNEEIEPFVVIPGDIVMTVESELDEGRVTGELEPMELDFQIPESSTENETELLSRTTIQDNDELPNVVIGSESWHNEVPEDWVPIITKDVQRQRRQNQQGPFSDAYLSGMPSKRRKIVNSSKPQGSLPQVIAESVKRAVTSTGLASVAPLDTVAREASTSPEIQTAYRSLLRSNVEENLKNNEDFTSERFPNASNYFTKPE